jgi:hypothetical protein
MLTKEISEVEKEIERFKDMRIYADDENINEEEYLLMQSEKLSTLKSAQAKFDKFVEDLKERFVEGLYKEWGNEWLGNKHEKMFILMEKIIDELSSKQEESC